MGSYLEIVAKKGIHLISNNKVQWHQTVTGHSQPFDIKMPTIEMANMNMQTYTNMVDTST
ncbi:hypothetical protein BLOT_001792 [Blomia tropicalis]|nr:hypothetical protein BLOT_001792 [Blomia tropicalis]